MVTVDQSVVPQSTPSAYAVPRAGANGKIGVGWIPDLSATYQPLSSRLTDIAALAVTSGNFIVSNGTTWTAQSGSTARTSIGLGTADSATFAGVTATDGTAVAISVGQVVSSRKTFTDTSGTVAGLVSEAAGNPGAASSAQYRATTFQARVSASNTRNLTNAWGLVGFSANCQHGGSGTVTGVVAARCANPVINGGGTITNAAGMLILGQKISGVTNGWSVYAEGNDDRAYFNHPLVLGQVSAKPTLASNQGSVHVKDVGGTAEVFVQDEAGNETQVSPHPADVMERHATLMQAVGLTPVSVPWGVQSEQHYAGVRVTADVAAAIRCVEWLMHEAGRDIELIREERFDPTDSFESVQQRSQESWQSEADSYDSQVKAWAAKPFWLRDENDRPERMRQRPQIKPQPEYLTRLIENLSA